MSTIIYEFDPGDMVWVIYNQSASMQKSNYSRTGCASAMDATGVSEGKVVYYRADVLLTETKEWYGISMKGADTTRDFNVADVFETIEHAMYEYERRLGGAGTLPNKVSQMVYDSVAPSTSHIVEHNFGFAEVSVEVYNTSGFKVVPTDVILQDENTVVVNFGTDSIDCKIVVTGRMNYS